MFSHNSELAKSVPSWGSIDKTKLPRAAFAEHGEAGKKSSWGYGHHWIQGGGNPDKNGVYTTGRMFLHKQGLGVAFAAANGARSRQDASPSVTAHLRSHRRAIGVEKMGSKSNYRKDFDLLAKSLSLESTTKGLSLALAERELEIALAANKKKKQLRPVPSDQQNEKEEPEVRYAWNLSQNQLDELQNPETKLVDVSPLRPNVGLAEPDGIHSPETQSHENPGRPTMVDSDNAKREEMMKLLPLLTALDTRTLLRCGIHI